MDWIKQQQIRKHHTCFFGVRYGIPGTTAGDGAWPKLSAKALTDKKDEAAKWRKELEAAKIEQVRMSNLVEQLYASDRDSVPKGVIEVVL
jgi:hypothetical protein